MKSKIFVHLAIWSVLLLAGCGADHETTLAPAGDPVDVQGTIQASDVDSQWIGPAGGSLTVTGRVLSIPKDALSVSTLITMTRNEDGSVELEPDGQTFAVDVDLYFVVPAGGEGADYAIQWYDPAGGEWKTIASEISGLGRTAPLEHFSLYRIQSMR